MPIRSASVDGGAQMPDRVVEPAHRRRRPAERLVHGAEIADDAGPATDEEVGVRPQELVALAPRAVRSSNSTARSVIQASAGSRTIGGTAAGGGMLR